MGLVTFALWKVGVLAVYIMAYVLVIARRKTDTGHSIDGVFGWLDLGSLILWSVSFVGEAAWVVKEVHHSAQEASKESELRATRSEESERLLRDQTERNELVEEHNLITKSLFGETVRLKAAFLGFKEEVVRLLAPNQAAQINLAYSAYFSTA